MTSRNDLRSKIFTAENRQRKAFPFNFFGADIEIRQPTAGDIIRYIDSETNNINMVNILLDYAYVPGTDEKVFESGDVDSLKELPYNEDMKKLTAIIEQFTGVMVGEAEKN